MTTEFSELSISLTKKLSKLIKKEQGIFFTPNTIIMKFCDNIPIDKFNEILEPSCGSGAFIDYIKNTKTEYTLDAVELNEIIFNELKEKIKEDKINLINQDYTQYNPNKTYDLIIGNPPYFVCSKEQIPFEYKSYIIGRPNMFGIFILQSIKLLKNNGVIAFIIPKSFLNTSYYSKIRNYLMENGNILKIIDFEEYDSFLETKQSTFGFIFQKTNEKKPCSFSMKIGNNYIFTTDLQKLQKIFENSTTLEKLGLTVKTGPIVWNENKQILSDDDTEPLLIYNSNITKNNSLCILKFSNNEKKQYIKKTGQQKPLIVVNRGNGNSAYKLNYAYIDGSKTFLVENHLNMIFSSLDLPINEIKLKYDIVINSFSNKKTDEFVKLFLGNNGLSKTELETIFPIYL